MTQHTHSQNASVPSKHCAELLIESLGMTREEAELFLKKAEKEKKHQEVYF